MSPAIINVADHQSIRSGAVSGRQYATSRWRRGSCSRSSATVARPPAGSLPRGRYVGFTFMRERSKYGFRAVEAWDAQRAGFVRGIKGAIASKTKHAIKLKTSPARLTHPLHNCCSPH